jgi:hypothetical protein
MTSLNDQSLDFNRQIKVNFDGGDLTNDAGLLLYKEFDEKMGLSQLIQSMVVLNDPVQHDVHTAPHIRHRKAIHLYQAGIPTYIKDFLGHSNINTTDRYAFADVSMMRKALEKVSKTPDTFNEKGIWEDNEELIIQLCGLK